VRTTLCFWVTAIDVVRCSKSYYLQQVHQPRHLPYSAPLLGGILEVRTVILDTTMSHLSGSISLSRSGTWSRSCGDPFAPTFSSALSSNLPAPFPLSPSVLPSRSRRCQASRSTHSSRPSCVSSREISYGQCSSIFCTGSCSTSMRCSRIDLPSSCCISCCMAFTISCLWTGALLVLLCSTHGSYSSVVICY
jgi:hypothetical protein